MATLTVGTGQQFSTIAAAVAASHDGDVVAVQAGTYVNDFAEVTDKITIEGVGGMAHLVASGPIPNGKGILVTDTNVSLQNLEFSGAAVSDGNGAGVRSEGGNLTVVNSYFHDNQDGLLSAADANGNITINNSEFANNGTGDGLTHNIYVGAINTLTIDNSYFTGAKVGHEIKTRAANTIITNSRIQDGPGDTSSYEIDVPNGGNLTVSNSVIEQSAASQNPAIISYGEEGASNPGGTVSLTGDTILNDLTSGSAVAVRNASGNPVSISNLKTFGLTSGQILSGSGTVSGWTALATEPALVTIAAYAAGSSGSSSSPASTPTTPTTTPTTPPSTPASTPTGALTGTGTLVLYVSEDAWQGDAQYAVTIDGTQVGGIRTATASHGSGQSQPVTVTTTLPTGTHQIGVTFLNDAYGGSASTDRNLYVDGAKIDGTAVSGAALSLTSAGLKTFSATEAGNGAASAAPPSSSPPIPTPTTASAPPSTPAQPTTGTAGLVLYMSEDAWQGDAQYTVSIDGQQVGGTYTATASHAAGQTQAVPLATTLTPGPHTVAVNFTNDAYGGSATADRNLYVDRATINGVTVNGSTFGYRYGGVQTFTATAAASSASSSSPTSTTPTSTTSAPTPPASSTPVTSSLTLKVSEDAFQGDAQMAVTVDGNAEGTFTVTASHAAGATQAVTITGLAESFTPHDIAINFLNDAYGGSPSADRNLYVNSATFDGQNVPGGALNFTYGGVQHFTAIAPANWTG